LDQSITNEALLSALIFLVAVLYSSVGHGGASGYLAILAFFAVPPEQMAATALILNVVVAGLASIAFIRAGHFSSRLFWPFALTSIPLAFVGGLARVSNRIYFMLLAIALVAASIRLMLHFTGVGRSAEIKSLSTTAAFPLGGAVGLLSGIVGVGGGIFLSPLLLLARWATASETAAVSAVFILVNSLAGLGGRLVGGHLNTIPDLLPLAAAILGGSLGSYWGARHFSGLTLRRTLAIVLLVAAVRLTLAVL